MKNTKLKDSANNTINAFRFVFIGAVQDELMEHEQNMDLFSALLKDAKMNKELIGVFVEAVYSNL